MALRDEQTHPAPVHIPDEFQLANVILAALGAGILRAKQAIIEHS